MIIQSILYNRHYYFIRKYNVYISNFQTFLFFFYPIFDAKEIIPAERVIYNNLYLCIVIPEKNDAHSFKRKRLDLFSLEKSGKFRGENESTLFANMHVLCHIMRGLLLVLSSKAYQSLSN